MFLLTFSVAQVAGYFVAELIFRSTGTPPEMPAHILSALTGVVLYAAVLGLIITFSGRGTRRRHNEIHDIFTDALAQIAQGNFNVLIDENNADVHLEFAAVINDMARNLGNLETMRQDFISNVSHEIQSPLTSISGFAALLKNADLPDDERRRYVEIIEAESKRLSSLSDNLLKLSTLDNESIATAEFRLDRQLSNIILTLEPQWSAKNLTVHAALQKCVASGDENLLSQVWMNLLVNAIKFTPENGVISVSLRENAVKISDTGIGIAKDDLPHIFERFYKVDKARDRALGGNGLGLSLVKKITELHGGRISVESEPRAGTTFEIFLPGLRSV
ncbi:MAG: HAMP domain-containing histidine kinase [Clostridiales Family XIII bacterium]|jgi:signal transduction histidine kinase|nr:HAMP domain-containing histidine kinase [Clostridiales Family XIII bacterium]